MLNSIKTSAGRLTVTGLMLMIVSARSIVEHQHIVELEKQLQLIGSGQIATQIMFDKQIQKQAKQSVVDGAKRRHAYCFGQAKILNYTGSEARYADYGDCLLRGFICVL